MNNKTIKHRAELRKSLHKLIAEYKDILPAKDIRNIVDGFAYRLQQERNHE